MIAVLGLGAENKPIVGEFPCTGMHGGRMFLRGTCEGIVFPPQVTARIAGEADMAILTPLVERYAELFGADAADLLASPFTVVVPDSRNPYKRMYVEN